MTNILNKKYKFSFGANNFTNSQPSNGTYLRLVLTSLSKKGNWGSLFRRFLKLSIQARKICNYRSKLSSIIENKLIEVSNYSLNSNQNPSNLEKTSRLLISLPHLNFEAKKLKNRTFFVLKNEKGNHKNENILSSLRSIYSLFHPILVSIELKSKRRGGRVFSVPVPVKSDKRRHSIFIRWFKQSLIEQSGSTLGKVLINELSQLSLREGKSMDRLVELDKTIKLNRVFLRKSQIKLI